MTKQEEHTTSLASFGWWQSTQRATVWHSSNPHDSELTTQRSTTMPRPSSVRARKSCTKQSALTTVPTRRPGERLRSSSSSSSKTHGCGNYKTRRSYIRTLSQRRCLPTSKQGAHVVMTLTLWRCIMKCSATTSKYRGSPGISVCSKMHISKWGEPAAQFPTERSSSLPARRCSQRSAIQEPTTIGRIEPRKTKHGLTGKQHTIGRTPKCA